MNVQTNGFSFRERRKNSPVHSKYVYQHYCYSDYQNTIMTRLGKLFFDTANHQRHLPNRRSLLFLVDAVFPGALHGWVRFLGALSIIALPAVRIDDTARDGDSKQTANIHQMVVPQHADCD